MKIRIMGSEDLVKAWAARLGELLGAPGDFYPMRGGGGVRWYVDVDDRLAMEAAPLFEPPPAASKSEPARAGAEDGRKAVKETPGARPPPGVATPAPVGCGEYVMADDLVRLETRSGVLVGWARLPATPPLWPDVLLWDDGDRRRIFRFASPDAYASHRLYIEAFALVLAVPVTPEPPAEST